MEVLLCAWTRLEDPQNEITKTEGLWIEMTKTEGQDVLKKKTGGLDVQTSKMEDRRRQSLMVDYGGLFD